MTWRRKDRLLSKRRQTLRQEVNLRRFLSRTYNRTFGTMFNRTYNRTPSMMFGRTFKWKRCVYNIVNPAQMAAKRR